MNYSVTHPDSQWRGSLMALYQNPIQKVNNLFSQSFLIQYNFIQGGKKCLSLLFCPGTLQQALYYGKDQ